MGDLELWERLVGVWDGRRKGMVWEEEGDGGGGK